MSSKTEMLLVELFTEELPPRALQKLGDAFASAIHTGLVIRGLTTADAAVEMFATPRRLAVRIGYVSAVAPDRAETKKLMPAKVAFDAMGNATPALQKRLEKEAAMIADTVRKIEGGEELIYLNLSIKGATLTEGLQVALTDAINKLPIPKVMTYQLADGLSSVQFVRPAHGLVAMHGEKVIAVSALGLNADNIIHGHRFQGAKNITLKHANEYETRLEKDGGVIASFEKRRHEIERLLILHAEQLGDVLGNRDDYVALLNEVTGLVEMPTVYVGKFEQEFLVVPAECLILTMKLNQKYFPLFLSADESLAGLSSRFLIVSNMRLDDPRNVIEGNQRVVRPRLSDAQFFFETDKKTKLIDRLPKLASVVYHNKLGTQLERSQRVKSIALWCGNELDPSGKESIGAKAQNAAELAKADLVTDMVGEFPELQGVMGRYYALNDGHAPDIALAIEEHYKPRFAGDSIPANDVGVALALADKVETLVGLFGIGQLPTGDKDPFALRRHALGVVRILTERRMATKLMALFSYATKVFGDKLSVNPAESLVTFTLERFAGVLKEQQHFSQNQIDAVYASGADCLIDINERLAALVYFSQMPEAASLAAANKRIGNILRQAKFVGETYSVKSLHQSAEIKLVAAMAQVLPEATHQYEQKEYRKSLQSLAALRQPVDDFFDQVMVNADDPAVRANRLGLLATLHRAMNQVADLSKLAA